MNEASKCSQCFQSFTVSRLPRSLGCGHNICEACLKELQIERQQTVMCEFCQKTLYIVDPVDLPYNQNVRLQLEDEGSKKGEVFGQIGELQGQSLLQECPAGQGEVISSKNEGEAQQLCREHRVAMDIICLTEKKKICPHCALFGAHKHHVFKRIQDFNKELQEKQHLFKEIVHQQQHHIGLETPTDIHDLIHTKVAQRKSSLLIQLNNTVQKIARELRQHHSHLIQQIELYFRQIETDLLQSSTLSQFTESKSKFQTWQALCWKDIKELQRMSKVQQKVGVYFNGPLELVSEGYIYLEKYTRSESQILKKIQNAISLRLSIQNDLMSQLKKIITLVKPGFTPFGSEIKENQDPNEINPFLDCTSSEICIPPPSLPQNNVSIEAQISSLTSSMKLTKDHLEDARKFSPLKQFCSVKSTEKVQKELPQGYKRRTITVIPSSSKSNVPKDLKSSESLKAISSKKLKKTSLVKPVILETDQKQYDLKQPEKIFTDFKKNTLTDFFDLSGCNLPSDKVLEFVALARKSHKIKGLKLCTNNLDSPGFQKMVGCLKGVSNINLANNQIDESIFEIILRHKDKLDLLRVLNLSHNPVNLQRKSKGKMEELKKMGVIILL